MNLKHLMSFPDGYPELLEQMGQVIYNHLLKNNTTEQATSTTFAIVENIRTEIGGVQQYIPRGTSYELSQREKKIWNDFDGNNYTELAQKYGITTVRIRNIVKQAIQREMHARQLSFFQNQN